MSKDGFHLPEEHADLRHGVFELVGMVCRCWPRTMNWWRVPEYGPSKPSARSLRMKSRRLSGRHPPILDLVQINAGEHRQFVPQS